MHENMDGQPLFIEGGYHWDAQIPTNLLIVIQFSSALLTITDALNGARYWLFRGWRHADNILLLLRLS